MITIPTHRIALSSFTVFYHTILFVTLECTLCALPVGPFLSWHLDITDKQSYVLQFLLTRFTMAML